MRAKSIFLFKNRMQKVIILSSNVIRYKPNSYSSVIHEGEKKRRLPETPGITSNYEVGLGLPEIGEFENHSVVKNLFLA